MRRKRLGGTILEDSADVDARTVYVQLLAIAGLARHVRQAPKTCTALEVDGILGAYAAARDLCHEVTCGEMAPVPLPDLGRTAEDKQYGADELRAILAGIEVECFKGVGALARIVALSPKEDTPKSQGLEGDGSVFE